MKKILNAIKRMPKRFIAICAVLLAVIIPVAINAWGPSRNVFTINKPATYVTFNSITDNPHIGDERNFVGIREKGSSDNKWYDSVEVQEGKEYLVRIYVHNNAAANLNLVANDVTTMFNLPATTGKSVEVNGFVTSSNANPTKIWDNAKFTSSKDFNMAYVAGSAKYVNNKGTFNLPDSIMTNSGAKLGYEQMDGKIPGCFQYAGYVTILVKPQIAKTPNIEVEKKVRKDSDKSWSDSVNVKPGETIHYQIKFTNTGEITLNNVLVYDTLPSNVSYVKGSTVLYNTNYPSGKSVNDDLFGKDGINIGSYNPKGNAYLRFTAKVAASSELECGETKLTNWAQANGGYGVKKDYANIVVDKECTEEPIYTCDSLSINKISRTKFSLSTKYTAKNGATYKDTTYIVKNSAGKEVAKTTTSGSWTFESSVAGTYTVESIVNVTVDGKTKTAAGDACKGKIVITEEEKENCTIPGKEHLPKGDPECTTTTEELPTTGPGAIFGAVLGAGSLTTSGAYYIASRKKKF